MKPSGNGNRRTNNLPVFIVVFSFVFFGLFIYIEDVKSMAEFSGFGAKTREIGGKQRTVQELNKNGELGIVSMNSSMIVESEDREDDSEETPEIETQKPSSEKQGNPQNQVQNLIENSELNTNSIKERDIVDTQLQGHESEQTLERESPKPISKKQGNHKTPVQESTRNSKLSSVSMNSRTASETQLGEDDSEQTRDHETVSRKQGNPKNPSQSSSASTNFELILEREGVELPPEECDLFTGEWVYANVTHPLYKEDECPHLTRQVTCLRNGRKDSEFQSWRWQPRDCSLPKFKARVLMEKLRDKRLMFVGDSLNRNQWESMICLVQSVAPMGNKNLTKNGSLSVFTMEDYNATVEFYWAPFIVESNSDDPNMHSVMNRIIMPESIEKHGQNWKNVDYLIFNTYIWWMNTGKMKVLRGSFDEGSTEYDEIPRAMAYERVLRTWSNWVDNNVDPNRTTVFFNSMSPLHIRSLDWGNPRGIKCALETTPIRNMSKKINLGTDRRLFVIAANLTLSMKIPVHFINITTLSEYRKDAHTGIYTIRQGKILTDEMKANPATYADCIHWCLPGLPDTWNEFLYTRIISRL